MGGELCHWLQTFVFYMMFAVEQMIFEFVVQEIFVKAESSKKVRVGWSGVVQVTAECIWGSRRCPHAFQGVREGREGADGGAGGGAAEGGSVALGGARSPQLSLPPRPPSSLEWCRTPAVPCAKRPGVRGRSWW